MTIVWGATLAAGILLVLSPWLWPARGRADRDTERGPGRLRTLLSEAGYAHAPTTVVLLAMAACLVVGAAAAWLLTAIPALALLAAVVAAAAPVAWLSGRRRALRRRRRMLWPDVCDLLIASVRSGLPLPEALAVLATSAPAPLRGAFAVYAADIAASGHFEASILRLKAQLADPVADRILETLRMTREVGGTELVPVLRSLSAAVRADAAVRAEVEARQSWVRGAAVLGVVSPWVILVLLAFRPEGARAYATPEGLVLICVSAVVSVGAFRLMVRLGRLPEPRRWFG